MSRATHSKYILQKQTYTKSTLSERPPRHPSLGKQNNLSFQQQAPNPERFCQNHRQRQSLFKIQTEGVPLFYCQRCAILLASQGFSVQKVGVKQQSIVKEQRQERDVVEVLQVRKQHLKKQITGIQEYYGRIVNNLRVYFDGIIQSVIKKKEQFQQFIKFQQEQTLESSRKQLLRIQKVFNEYFKFKSLPVSNSSYRTLNSNININNRSSGVRSIQCVLKQMRQLSIESKLKGMEDTVVKDIVTIDVNSIIQIINDSLKIKVNDDGEEENQESGRSSILNREENVNRLTMEEYSMDEYQS